MTRHTTPPAPRPHGPDALDQLRELVESDGRSQGEIAAAAGMAAHPAPRRALGSAP